MYSSENSLSRREKEDAAHRNLVDSFGKRLENKIADLNQLADRIAQDFPNVDPKNLPEYSQLVDAINVYRNALIRKLDEDYEARTRGQ